MTELQNDRITELQNDRQDKNNMPPDLRSRGHKKKHFYMKLKPNGLRITHFFIFSKHYPSSGLVVTSIQIQDTGIA